MAASSTARKTTTLKARLTQPATPLPATTRARRLRLPDYTFFRFKRIKHPGRLPSVWQLTRRTFGLLWRYRWLFLGMAAVYGVLDVLLVQGLSAGPDVSSLKHQLSQALAGHWNQLAISLSVFASLLASSGNNSNATAGSYQTVLALIVSLATVWLLRQVLAGERVRLRDAFYKGMYPLIPFILVLLVVLLQLLPFLIGVTLFNLVVNNGIAAHAIEIWLWGVVFILLAAVSAYLLCSSLFALYIVTLPDMTPLKALRSARQLVRYRRAIVLRKLLFLPVMLLVIAAIIMVPIIMVAAIIAPWLFFALTVCGLIVIHTYMYSLYRELLQ